MKRQSKIALAIIIILLAFLLFWLWPRGLTAMHYEVKADITKPIRIVQLTDLHGAQFGENNQELILLVKEQQPDLIFMTGDMLDCEEADVDEICSLISKLSEIAPVYYSYGNHETELMRASAIDLKTPLEEAGARVLEMEYEDVTVNGQELRIGGYAGYYRTPVMETFDEDEQAERLAFADDFENTGRQKLLLAHIATSWTDWERINRHPVGVVFCGHYHGGQIRFPIVNRGLFAPYVGWFPEYTKGVFEGKCATCVLSAGLGSNKNIPRIYNPPEIVVVDLVPQN